MNEEETLAQLECENCMRLIGEKGELEDANERLMEQIIKLERTIDMLIKTGLSQSETIQKLTEERLGPEKSLYEQAKGLGIGIDARQDPAHDPRRVERAFNTLTRAIEAEGYRVLVDPDGVYSVEKKEFDFKT